MKLLTLTLLLTLNTVGQEDTGEYNYLYRGTYQGQVYLVAHSSEEVLPSRMWSTVTLECESGYEPYFLGQAEVRDAINVCSTVEE